MVATMIAEHRVSLPAAFGLISLALLLPR